ncbi:PadR family transcriptional regulator [Fodinicola feengrottensis]|uniref:PadR family transcriptional regulator n=1 Tax=Fodinicola feengrottensis TaxID=435914 RepID=A0ABN2HWZ5_9ACTN
MAELRRSDRDLVALTVLALLMTGPKHTYEMHRMMIDTHKTFVTGLPRSMYHAVERLLKDNFIDAVDTLKDGPRPERTVYALTDAGRAELSEREERLLRTPDADSTLLVAALSYLGCLSVDQARAALTARVETLDRQVAAATATLTDVGPQLHRLLLLELEYDLARETAEARWVGQLIADLADGTLDWPADPRELIKEMPFPKT